jgi:outer membrane protein OmpA-like peptidoglycan-associated protein/tetratricopeptide (TPR) repeat protein
MKKFKNISFFIIFVLTCIGFSSAQNSKVKRAGEKFKNLEYIDAIDVYLRVANSGYESEELFRNLADSYYFNANYEEAEQWYKRLFEFNGEQEENISYLRYAQTLRANGKDNIAKNIYDKFLKSNFGNNVIDFKTSEDYLDIILSNSGRYKVKSAPFNTKYSDYGLMHFDKSYLFTTSRTNNSFSKRKDNWTGDNFTDIWEGEIVNDTVYELPKRLGIKKINTKFHDASPYFTNDRSYLYLTRNNVTPKIKLTKKDKVTLKIYRAELKEDKVVDLVDLSINSDTYSTANPVLNHDGSIMFYTSNQPGGYGESDIYKVAINPDGTLGVPENLGPAINTKGRETFPYVTKDNKLYFSSDGHFGLGGLDVFYVDLNQKVLQMVNVGSPVNSSFDDFAFTIDQSSKRGTFSSNRPSGLGNDDIYLFSEIIPIEEDVRATSSGVIYDKKDDKPIKNVKITLKDTKGNILDSVVTDENGNYQITFNKYYDNYVIVEKENYQSEDDYIKANTVEDKQKVDFYLTKNVIEVTDGSNLNLPLNIQPIYFEFDSFKIVKESEVELMKIVEFMKLNESVKVRVASHTDSRGSDVYNMELSQKRADATVAYIVSKGIDSFRLESIGFGESKLRNNCIDGKQCSDALHEENRRSEFSIKK